MITISDDIIITELVMAMMTLSMMMNDGGFIDNYDD